MPKPREGEKKDEYIDRCIAYVMEKEGVKNRSHAYAKCNGMWEQYKKKNKSPNE